MVGVKTMIEVYNDWDSLFERFCIITVDGGLSDFSAINSLSDKAPKELIAKLMDFSRMQDRLSKCKKRSN